LTGDVVLGARGHLLHPVEYGDGNAVVALDVRRAGRQAHRHPSSRTAPPQIMFKASSQRRGGEAARHTDWA